jgi:hypothetical protein
MWVEALESWSAQCIRTSYFGVPIVIGSNYSHFAEAIALVNIACTAINNQQELNEVLKNS